MKELVPACPRCNTSKFVVRDRIAEKQEPSSVEQSEQAAPMPDSVPARRREPPSAPSSPYSAQQPEQVLERSPARYSASWPEAQPATP